MNLEKLEQDLKEKIRGEVRFDPQSKALYATDASNYRQVPLGVVLPTCREDIIQTIALCRKYSVPVLSRGGGTSLAGQCCNVAVVMDMSKHFNQILEINVEEKWARIQPGIVLDNLREAAAKHRLTFGPDPSTHSRCTLGGMMGNNSCGVHSVMAGRTADNVFELEVLTYDGIILRVGKTSPEELDKLASEAGRKGEIFRKLRALRDQYASQVRDKYPRIPRRVSGYNLDNLLPEKGFDLAKALVGSEGTCVCILEAKVRLVDSRPERALVVIGFEDIYSAAAAVPEVMKGKPVGLEAIDDRLVGNLRRKRLHVEDLPLLPEGNSWLLVEMGADARADLENQAKRMKLLAATLAGNRGVKVYDQPAEQSRIWKVRESGLGATAYVPGQRDTWEGWEDSAVPPEQMAAYLKEFRQLLDKYNYEGVFYGHFGQGCLHTRITFDLVTREGIGKYHEFTVEAAHLVVKFGGSLSGEHGDGQSRAELLPIMFGEALVGAFREFKTIWDPEHKMNPGKVVEPYKNTENLRLGADYHPWTPVTVFQFPEDQGSLARASIRCVGVGACRQQKGGVMCPSYQATREEKHSTRGRARLLFEMLEGEVIPSTWRNEAVKDALDLCLACKGCKGECPVNVDMASYKAEFLHHYYKGRLRPRHAYAMGLIAPVSSWASRVPRIANFATQTPGLAAIAKFLAGIHPERSIPAFAEETFRHWYDARKPLSRAAEPRPQVVLWPDTFSNYFHPEVAKAALKVLEAVGYEVLIPRRQFCCGRPLYDFGFLPLAKKWLERILSGMRKEIRLGLPFVFLEPSCATVFRDELSNLLPHDLDATRLKKQAFLLSEFLAEKVPGFDWPKLAGSVLVQGHCHHRSVLKFESEHKLLERIADGVEMVSSSCCGMAGSFGFEKEHYELSQTLGAQALYPAVAKSGDETVILANGFSCREQIRQGTGRKATHLAQYLELALAAGHHTPRN